MAVAVASYRLHFVGVWLRSVPLQALQPTTQVARVLLSSQPDPLLAPHSHAPGLQDLRWVALRAPRSRGYNSAESNLVLSFGFVAYVDKGKAEFLLESSERPSTHPSPGCVCTAVTRRREGAGGVPNQSGPERQFPNFHSWGGGGGKRSARRPGWRAGGPRNSQSAAPPRHARATSGSRVQERQHGPRPWTVLTKVAPPPAPVSLGPLPCLISN